MRSPLSSCCAGLANSCDYSIAFVIYTLIIFVINLYATTGRNAPTKEDRNNIAMTAPRSKWYSRVPNVDSERPLHVLGEDEEEE